MIPVTFAIVDDATPAAALEGVSVRVYTADGTTFITVGTTDAAGEISLDLVDGTQYWVRFYLPGYAFPSKLLFLVDSAAVSNTWDIVGNDIVARPPAMDPNLCRATGQVITPAGQPVDGITFRFMMTEEARVVGGRVVIPNNTIIRSQHGGFVQVDLIRNNVYEVGLEGIPGLEPNWYTIPRILVPDLAATSFVELLWPHVSDVTLSGVTATVASGSTLDVDVTSVLLSSGVSVPLELDCDEEIQRSYYLTVVSGDPLIVGAAWNSDETAITLTGVAPGVTTVTVNENPLSRVPRQPALPETLATITVTVT